MRIALAMAAASLVAVVQAQQPPTPPPMAPIPLDAPPTGPQRPVPAPLHPTAKPQSPLKSSPSLAQIAPSLVQNGISLDDAISVGLSTNPELAQAGENLYYAQGRVKEAKSALYPTLGVVPGESYIKRTAAPAYVLQATLPLDIAHILTSATEQAQFEELASRLDVNRVRNEVVYNVESRFFDVLRAKALVTVANQNLQNSIDRLNDAKSRYKAQVVAYIDVVRTETDVANAQKELIAANAGVSNAVASLANSMGIEVTTDLKVREDGAASQPPLPAAPQSGAEQNAAETSDSLTKNGLALGPEFQSVLTEALKTRPEILEADANISAAQKGIAVARRSELPSLAISVGYYDLRAQTGSQINEPQAFAGLSIPIYDAGLARAREQEARAVVSQAQTVRRQQVDAVTLDVQRAYLAVVQARDQVAVATQAVTQAQVGFDLARVRYKAGVAAGAGLSPQLEVSDAQNALTLAEQNQVNALYDYNSARAQLDRSVGRFAFVGGPPKQR